MAKIDIKKSEIFDVYNLASRLRQADKKEVELRGFTSFKGLEESFKQSFICKSVFEGDKIIGMFGAVEINNNWVRMWFLGSDECEKYPITFLREGKKFTKELLKDYNIYNLIYRRNNSHIEYVQRLGFEIKEYDKNFYEFYKLRPSESY